MGKIAQTWLAIKAWVLSLLGPKKACSMAIVRRYADANGAFVGELYILGSFAGVQGYQMIGVSLDTLVLDTENVADLKPFLDTTNDFLAYMPRFCVRVGALDPKDNDRVREYVARLAKKGVIRLQVQNRFIEHVMSKTSGKGDTEC